MLSILKCALQVLEPDEAIIKQVVRDGSQSKSYL